MCNLVIDNRSCENIVSSALVDYLKLETEPHTHLYTIGWIKKGSSIKIIDLCYIPISIGKYYQDIAAYDLIDMEACHILFGRSWHHDVNAAHRSKENIYMFKWKGRRIPWDQFHHSKGIKRNKVEICFSGQRKITPSTEVSEKVELLLEESKRVAYNDLLKRLIPMRDIQYQ